MASEELTLREVFLADAYEEHVAHLNKRLKELERKQPKSCGFCSKRESEVKRMFYGTSDAICSDCVDDLAKILARPWGSPHD